MNTQHGSRPAAGTVHASVSYRELIVLTRWMANHGCTGDEVAYAVEKPWKHADWIRLAHEGAEFPDEAG